MAGQRREVPQVPDRVRGRAQGGNVRERDAPGGVHASRVTDSTISGDTSLGAHGIVSGDRRPFYPFKDLAR